MNRPGSPSLPGIQSTLQAHVEASKQKKTSNVAFIVSLIIALIGFGLITLGFVSVSNLAGFAAIGVAVYLITLLQPLYGLAATIIAFSVSSDVMVAGIPLRLEDFMIPALAICWFIQHLNKRHDLTQTLLKRPFLGIAAVGLLSTAVGLTLGLVTSTAAAQFYIKSVEYLVLYFVAINIMKTRDDVRMMFIALMVASAFVGIWGAWQAINYGEMTGFRVSGPNGETANILGGFYVFAMLLAAGMFFTIDNLRLKIVIFLYLSVIMLWPLLETLSRASFVSFLLALSIIGVITKQRILLWVGLLMVLIPVAFPEDIYDRMRTVLGVVGVGGEEMPSSFADKILGWKIMMTGQFLNNPLFGNGVGSISLQIDSEYFKILGETGVIGLLLFAWMIRTAYKMAWQVYKGSKNNFDQGLALGFLGAMTALLLQGFSGTVFTTMRTMQPFMVACAMITVILRIRSEESQVEPRHSGKRIDAMDRVPPIGQYTVAELFRQRYRQN